MNPRISQFFGIKINMYYNDHNPPHFHVKYNEYNCFIGIENIEILEGCLPKKIEKLVIAWAELYQKELQENWELSKQHKVLNPILPLMN